MDVGKKTVVQRPWRGTLQAEKTPATNVLIGKGHVVVEGQREDSSDWAGVNQEERVRDQERRGLDMKRLLGWSQEFELYSKL